MDKEKQPHWIFVIFVTATVTAVVNQTTTLFPSLWGGLAHIGWPSVLAIVVSICIGGLLLFGGFLLGIRHTICTFETTLFATSQKDARDYPYRICIKEEV